MPLEDLSDENVPKIGRIKPGDNLRYNIQIPPGIKTWKEYHDFMEEQETYMWEHDEDGNRIRRKDHGKFDEDGHKIT